MRWRSRFAAAALAMLMLTGGGALAEKQVVLTFVGDCTVGCEDRLYPKETSFYQYALREGYDYFLAKVRDFFSEDDLTVANFEGVLKENGFRAANKTYCFRGLPDFARILTLGGIEAVNLANNHTGDFGQTGRVTTMAALSAAGVGYFDSDDTYVFEKDGVKIAFCGFWGVGFNNRKDIAAHIQRLREEGANAVVCALHFGEEYATFHSKAQIEAARSVIDAGADLVVGHHPHVAQGVEAYHSRTIFYSLGNFLFGGNESVRANGCLVPRVTLTFDDDGNYLGQQVRLYPADISGNATQNDYQPRLVTGDAAEAVFARVDNDNAGERNDVKTIRRTLDNTGVQTVAYEQTDAWREYDFLPAGTDGETP